MNTKLLIPILALLAASIPANAETIDGSDPRVTYIGRTASDNGATSFDWSGTRAKVKFSGSSLALQCSDTHADYFNVWVDKEPCAIPDQVIRLNSKDTTIAVFKGKRGIHEVIFQKRTEAEQGTSTFIQFFSDGKFLQTEASPRLIEFIGDSYTCGFGTESFSRTDPFKPETENPSMTYADIIGRYFDAETVHISHSGRGVARNYGGYNGGQQVSLLYKQRFNLFCQDAWTPQYHPDIVVIYLGTNDFSCGEQPQMYAFSEKYQLLLRQVREFHPDVPILCMTPMADLLLQDYIREAVRASGLRGVQVMDVNSGLYDNNTDLGASWHPNYSGQTKLAHLVIPYIATITGWGLQEKIVR